MLRLFPHGQSSLNHSQIESRESPSPLFSSSPSPSTSLAPPDLLRPIRLVLRLPGERLVLLHQSMISFVFPVAPLSVTDDFVHRACPRLVPAILAEKRSSLPVIFVAQTLQSFFSLSENFSVCLQYLASLQRGTSSPPDPSRLGRFSVKAPAPRSLTLLPPHHILGPVAAPPCPSATAAVFLCFSLPTVAAALQSEPCMQAG
jgi:hypothetical protein